MTFDIEKELEFLKKNGWIKDVEAISKMFNVSREVNKRTKKKLSINNCINNSYILPEKKNIFNAFKLFEMKDTRILILGQDPYTKETRAHGYAFSFKNGQQDADDSLLNIFKAIAIYRKKSGKNIKKDVVGWNTNLENWARDNNVLLLNTALTYDKTNSLTERKNAWEPFITTIIQNLLASENKLVVFLWGNKAENLFNECIKNIEIKRNILVLKSNHPSPLSVNNGGNFPKLAPVHFAACDNFLDEDKKEKDKLNTWKNIDTWLNK